MESGFKFAGKVILVTGSSSGLGAEIARLFAKLGGRVVVTGLNKSEVETIVDKCNQLSPSNAKALGITGDLSADTDLRRAVETTLNECKQINVLVNNAGIAGKASIDDPNLMEDYDRTMNINLRTVVHLSHLMVPHLVKTKGCIINTSSFFAKIPLSLPGSLSYGASKAGLDMVTKHLALVLGPRGVRVNAIHPGMMKTEILTKGSIPNQEIDAFYEATRAWTPLNMYGFPSDVAPLVAFLASDYAKFMTGGTYAVDGGLMVKGPA